MNKILILLGIVMVVTNAVQIYRLTKPNMRQVQIDSDLQSENEEEGTMEIPMIAAEVGSTTTTTKIVIGPCANRNFIKLSQSGKILAQEDIDDGYDFEDEQELIDEEEDMSEETSK